MPVSLISNPPTGSEMFECCTAIVTNLKSPEKGKLLLVGKQKEQYGFMKLVAVNEDSLNCCRSVNTLGMR